MKLNCLFLDDERMPADWMLEQTDCMIARTVEEAEEIILEYGLPDIVSLDHDLGKDQQTGYDFVKWLIEKDLDGALNISVISKFYVHSQNCVGADNMLKLWHNYNEFRDGQKTVWNQ